VQEDIRRNGELTPTQGLVNGGTRPGPVPRYPMSPANLMGPNVGEYLAETDIDGGLVGKLVESWPRSDCWLMPPLPSTKAR